MGSSKLSDAWARTEREVETYEFAYKDAKGSGTFRQNPVVFSNRSDSDLLNNLTGRFEPVKAPKISLRVKASRKGQEQSGHNPPIQPTQAPVRPNKTAKGSDTPLRRLHQDTKPSNIRIQS